MYNMSKQVLEFHDEHVKLSEDEKKKLRDYKTLNLGRLEDGLDELNEENGTNYKIAISYEQGSVSMSTLTQNDTKEYDIDIAVIFDEENIPDDPADARKVVETALLKKCLNFSDPPTARTNAVTIWYKDGYHIDFAVYRKRITFWGNTVYEHAGEEWTERDPVEVKKWFTNEVASQSPQKNYGATVRDGQMRRVVRLLKMFSKSRLSWSLPGGFILSALVSECYKPSYSGDDVAFYNTMVSIRDRLNITTNVYNPVHIDQLLNHNDKTTKKINRLRSKLDGKLDKLDKLFESNCDEKSAKKAWNKFFNHNFWSEEVILAQSNIAKMSFNSFNAHGYNLDVNVDIYFRKNGKKKLPLIHGIHYILKNKWILFNAKHNVTQPYTIKWDAYNYGDEAEEARDTHHTSESSNNDTHWESTKYRGPHIMVCSIVKSGRVVAKNVVEIDIA